MSGVSFLHETIATAIVAATKMVAMKNFLVFMMFKFSLLMF